MRIIFALSSRVVQYSSMSRQKSNKVSYAALAISLSASLLALLISWNNRIPTISTSLPSPGCTPVASNSPTTTPTETFSPDPSASISPTGEPDPTDSARPLSDCLSVPYSSSGFLLPSRGIKFPDGSTQETATLAGPRGFTGATGPQGNQGIQGIQGPPGGFGYYGSFYDDADVTLASGNETPIPLNRTAFSNGVTIAEGYKITFAYSGKYNIAFSSQLDNAANQRRIVTIWLTKNGIAQANWVTDSATDVFLGTTTESERSVAAWNFFVEAVPGDYYALMIVANGTQVTLHGSTSTNTSPTGIPAIPSTILTVNQIG